MNENSSIQNIYEQNSLPDIILENIYQKVFVTITDEENMSKEKYTAKIKLIENAADMSTREKLDAMDKNYDRRTQEYRQNILPFAVISLCISGLVIGSPIAAKNIQKLRMVT